MQDLFIRLRRSPGFAGASNRVSYAYRTAIRLAYDWRRTQNRRRESGTLDSQQPAVTTAPELRLIHEEEIEQLLDAMGQLSERNRQVVVLRYIQGQSYELVGQRIGRSAQHARTICSRAIRQLQRIMCTGTKPHIQELRNANTERKRYRQPSP